MPVDTYYKLNTIYCFRFSVICKRLNKFLRVFLIKIVMGSVLNVRRIISFRQKKLLAISKHKDYLENDEN